MKKTYLLEAYSDAVLSIKRGTHNGAYMNAKPLFLLTIISLIDKGMLKLNRIFYNEVLKNEYHQINEKYLNTKETPLFKPYVFMSAEPFYHICWKVHQERLPNDSNNRFVKDNIEYALLDNALWDILQDNQQREYIKELIINTYLK